MRFLLLAFLMVLGFSCHAEECDFIIYNQCISCNEPLAFQVGNPDNCTSKCFNRIINTYGSGSMEPIYNCALKECPSDKPYQTANGACFDTPHEDRDFVFLSIPKFNIENPEKDERYKPFGKCPSELPLQSWHGICLPCGEEKIVRLDMHCNIDIDCDICPNRVVVKGIGGNIPSIPTCPEDRRLMDDEGGCYSCDEKTDVYVHHNPDFCERFCGGKRFLSGDLCVLGVAPIINEPILSQKSRK